MDIEIDNTQPTQANPQIKDQILMLLNAECLFKKEYAHLSSGKLDNVVVPIPYSHNRPQFEERYPGVNDLKELKNRQTQYLTSILEESFKPQKKMEEETKVTNSSCSQKLGRSVASGHRRIRRCSIKDSKIKITPKRRDNMSEILKKFREEKSQKTKKFVERYFSKETNFKGFDADFRNLLKKSKHMKSKASKSIKKIGSLFEEIDKTTAENLECEI